MAAQGEVRSRGLTDYVLYDTVLAREGKWTSLAFADFKPDSTLVQTPLD